uniref:E3 ubiquitin-protein ligase n=1 Tax=Plectus sambesii TaxID=2011161 RepID=A0A914VGI4_9BILA
MASCSSSTLEDAAEASTSATKPQEDTAAAVAGDGTNADAECAVCLQNCTFPVKLPPCAHVFCFLCIKGAAFRSGRCPLCRTPIPPTFFDDLRISADKKVPSKSTAFAEDATAKEAPVEKEDGDEFEWYYEARNGGWWRYETRQETELEAAFAEEKDRLELLIAGHVYVVDLQLMLQYRKDQPARRRTIKRNRCSVAIDIKGIAGLRIE